MLTWPFVVYMIMASTLSTAGSVVTEKNRTMDFHNVSATIEGLLAGYDLRLRPHFAGEPLGVHMDVVIASFDSISEVNMDYTITLYLNQHWSDPRLVFPYGNDSLTLPAEFSDRIWVPDTFFANDKNSYLHEVTEKNKMLKLYPNGSIVYGMRFTTTLACMMDLHNYPLDEQDCTIEIESYGYTMDDVKMYWRRGKASVEGVDRVSLPQFTIVGYETKTKVETLTTGAYPRLSLSFKLQRNIGYFIFQTYLPSFLIVMLSWVSFWINHEATSARVALGITTVLTMTTISNGVRQSLPRISYVKAIDIYIVLCFVFVFAALLEYAAVNYKYWGARYKRKKTRNKEQALRYSEKDSEDAIELKPINMSPILGLRGQSQNSATLECYENNTPSLRMAPAIPRTYMRAGQIHTQVYRRRSNGNSHKQKRRKILSEFREKARSIGKISIPKVQDVNTIDKFSRIMFPLLFTMFNFGYWIFYAL